MCRKRKRNLGGGGRSEVNEKPWMTGLREVNEARHDDSDS